MRYLILVGVMICVNVFASDFKLLTSLTTSGDFSGGIRYVKSAKEVIDFGVTYDETQDNASPGYWVDYYHGYFGGMISSPANQSPTYSLMFAAEGELSSTVGVGIGCRILDVQNDRATKVLTGWDAYLVIPI